MCLFIFLLWWVINNRSVDRLLMMMMIFMPASKQTDLSVGKLLNAFHLWLLTTKIREGVIDEADEADDDDDDDDDEQIEQTRERGHRSTFLTLY